MGHDCSLPAKDKVTGPASLSCIDIASILSEGSLVAFSSGSSILEEVVVLKPLSWRLVVSPQVSGGFKIKGMEGVLKKIWQT